MVDVDVKMFIRHLWCFDFDLLNYGSLGLKFKTKMHKIASQKCQVLGKFKWSPVNK